MDCSRLVVGKFFLFFKRLCAELNDSLSVHQNENARRLYARIFILVYTRFNRNFSLLLSRVGVAIFSVVYYLFWNIRLLSLLLFFSGNYLIYNAFLSNSHYYL